VSIDPGHDTRPSGEGPGSPVVDRTGRRALWLALGGWAVLFIQTLSYLAVIPLVAAVVIGIRARRAAKAKRAVVPGALAGIILAAVGLVIFTASLTVQLIMLDELNRFNKCRNSTSTITGENRCKDQLARDIERKFGLPEGTVKGRSLPF
jgi:hypothetical protein